ncbi:MAG: DUF5018 domain-containing protein [Akkermansiaceae bacterium]|nr:DUF5018 domain-containing protein [Akkermansiaceae bacterium]
MNINPRTLRTTGTAVRGVALALAVTAALAITPSAHAQLTLVETGGGLMVPNYSTQPGATAFAKDLLGGGSYAVHQIAHVNDGVYGNSNSWIGNDSLNSFCGVSFGATAVSINIVAWGRDNTGGYGDRYSGTYTLEYTTEPNPNELTASWTLIGTTQGLSPLRHAYSFPVVAATGIRLTCTSAGTCIDELEAGATSGASMLTFTWVDHIGVIDQNASPRTVTLHVPSSTNLNPLDPNPVFTLYPGATCDRDSGGTGTYDFTTPQTYTVTAANGVDATSYEVTILADIVIPPAPTPPPVAGYSRWFEPSQVFLTNDGDPVATWLDASGNGADATVPAGNATPTYVADAGTGTGLGAVHFAAGTGGSPALTCGALKFAGDGSIRTVFSVFKGTSFLLTDSGSYHFHRLANNDPACPLWGTPNASDLVKNGSTYVNGALVNGETFNMPTNLHNGFNLVEVLTTGDVTASSFNKDRLYNSGDQYQGEVIIYDFLLTEAERLAVENYLMTKWFATTPQAKITTFGTNVTGSRTVIDPVIDNAASIAWAVPSGTDVTTLAPDFTLSIGATCALASGSTQDFTAPVVYTVISSDEAITNVYTVTVTVLPQPTPTTSMVINLGTSPDGTVFTTAGLGSLFIWIAKGSLPVGSILRSVTATDVKLEANPNNAWASDLGVFVDPTPETPGGPGGLLNIADDTDFGGAGENMNWHSQGQNDGPMTETMLAGVDFSTTIDLNTAAVMIGNGYGDGTKYSGTITVTYDDVSAGSYTAWADINAGGQTAEKDFNNDGVQNGIAYFMGVTGIATNPDVVDGKVAWPHSADATGITYRVLTSEDLGAWMDVTGNAIEDGGFLTYNLPKITQKLFVRLEVVAP